MPTVSVERDILFTHLGHTYTDEQFDELCFEFGVELDEITSEREEAIKSTKEGSTKGSGAGLSQSELDKLSSAVLYKIDVPANRYDLLCIEGLCRGLLIFLGDIDSPRYTKITPTTTMQTLTVKQSNTDQIRPYVVSAILRDVTFDEQRYQSFLELQDQLHRNLCRQRTLVAIGTHDLDTIVGPFMYDARPPSSIKFKPLTHEDREFDAKSLLEFYSTDPTCKHLKPYVPIIYDSPLYPVVVDANETVLSLPPLINGSHSKITLATKNVFIECTATDLTKANIVLDTVVCMFSEYCEKPYTAEPVEVRYVNDEGIITKSYVTPELQHRKETAKVEFVNSLIGINVSGDTMKQLCEKVQLGPASLIEGGEDGQLLLEVTVPPTRSDILHAVDVAEDIGIAYGYNNIVKRVPQTCTVGGEQPLNLLGDLLRGEIARAGYTEVLTHGLSSIHDNFTALRRPIKLPSTAVSLSNPANIEYQVVRTTLLPGLLKTLEHNKASSFTKGFKLFEISDVVLVDSKETVCDTIVGAKNVRKVCAVYAGPTSGFEIIHGLVDRIMTLSEICPKAEYVKNSAKGDDEKYRVAREGYYYTIREGGTNADAGTGGDDDMFTYFPGRCAEILLKTPAGKEDWMKIGSFGILHPEVLKEFDIQYPTSSMEFDLEPLM